MSDLDVHGHHAHHALHVHHHHDDAPAALTHVPTDPAQESLNNALRASFNVLRLVMVALLVAYIASGIFTVNTGEQGLIVRLGKLRAATPDGDLVFRQGLHWALPDPFDEKIRISGQTHALQIATFTIRRDADDKRPLSETIQPVGELQPGRDGAMLSGDRNLSHGLWTIYYRIVDADRFVQNVGERPEAVEPVLRRLSENAIVQAAAERPIDEIIRTGIDTLRDDVTSRIRQALAALDTGVEIDKIDAETIEPGVVRQAFRMVTDAQNERQLLIERAYERRNEILAQTAGSRERYEGLLDLINQYGAAQAAGADQARLDDLLAKIDERLEEAGGEVAVNLQDARSRSNEIREKLRREFEAFREYREAFRQHPLLTVTRLWTAMREAVLSSRQNEIIFISPYEDEIEIHINKDPQRVIEAERERYRRQMTGEMPQGQ